jgi:DNA polymerase III epsilon subunit-like protein
MSEKSSTYSSNKRKKPGRAKNSRGAKGKNKVFKSMAWRSRTEFKSESVKSTEFLSKKLADTNFVVFDIETTGGNPERNGITEIFGIKFENGECKDTFYSMVNPQIPIPRIVRKMTGITNAMVKDAPLIDEVMPGLVEFLGDSILVSHNTIGDLKFLRHFAYECCGHNLNNFFLCTHLLSEKLISEAPDKSLKGLCQFLGFSREDSHRAETDTYMTLDLFKELLKRLDDKKSITGLEFAIRFQGDLESALRLGWGVSEDQLRNNPNSSGLFYLFDREDNLLFYSSSQNLNRDIKSLSKYNQLPKQLLRKVLNTYKIQVKPTKHFLEAFLEEVTDKRKSKMSYEPSQWHLRMIHVIKAVREGDRFLISVGKPQADAEFLFGKIHDRKEAFDLLRKMSEVFGTSVSRKGFYVDKEKYDIVKDFLENNLNILDAQLSRKRWNPFFWLVKGSRKSVSNKKSLISRLAELPKAAMRNLDNVHGLVVAGEMKLRMDKEKSPGIKIYPIKNGAILEPVEFDGNYEDWKNTNEYQVLLKDLKKSHDGSTTKSAEEHHDGRLNLGLWIATSKFRKNEIDLRYEPFPFEPEEA